jgi:hypothetical protein
VLIYLSVCLSVLPSPVTVFIQHDVFKCLISLAAVYAAVSDHNMSVQPTDCRADTQTGFPDRGTVWFSFIQNMIAHKIKMNCR